MSHIKSCNWCSKVFLYTGVVWLRSFTHVGGRKKWKKKTNRMSPRCRMPLCTSQVAVPEQSCCIMAWTFFTEYYKAWTCSLMYWEKQKNKTKLNPNIFWFLTMKPGESPEMWRRVTSLHCWWPPAVKISSCLVRCICFISGLRYAFWISKKVLWPMKFRCRCLAHFLKCVKVPPEKRMERVVRTWISGNASQRWGDDIHVPLCPPRQLHLTFFCAPQWDTFFLEMGCPHVWHFLNSSIKQLSFTIVFDWLKSDSVFLFDFDDAVEFNSVSFCKLSLSPPTDAILHKLSLSSAGGGDWDEVLGAPVAIWDNRCSKMCKDSVWETNLNRILQLKKKKKKKKKVLLWKLPLISLFINLHRNRLQMSCVILTAMV